MRRTPQQWLTLFQTQEDSDLSIKQFCLEHSISTSSFYKNKAALSPDTSIATTTVVSPFSQVCLVESEQRNSNSLQNIKLTLGNVDLTLDSKTEVDWLVSLVGKLA